MDSGLIIKIIGMDSGPKDGTFGLDNRLLQIIVILPYGLDT